MRSRPRFSPAFAQDAAAVGKRSRTDGTRVPSRKTCLPVASRISAIARATTSRGASSARGSKRGMNRSPSASRRTAPSPRRASVSRLLGCPGTSRAVGWNWTNSRSASAAPASQAMAMPWPVARSGPVRRPKIPVPPPVARIVRSASTSPPAPSARTARTRPSSTRSDAARASIHWIRRSSLVEARRARRIANPVASPPACRTRRALCPPSSVGAPPSSKTIPRRRSSAIAFEASVVRIRTASGSPSPAPAVRVSAAWAAGSSPLATAAAIPPWARAVELAADGSVATIVTGPRSAACSAAHRPPAPAPTTTVLTDCSRSGDGDGGLVGSGGRAQFDHPFDRAGGPRADVLGHSDLENTFLK